MSETTIKGTSLSRGERLQVMLDEDELTVIDDFRFSNRMPTRAAAVRELLRRGLEAVGYTLVPGVKSSSYGVRNGGNGDESQAGSE
ncbi:hypothetical protein [Bosea sp. BIWAKO-01]|uniref:hypothetical protein n=1 Tax=Bosea sp. BIWAKO-01 TaxID=506668 RepID=UPI000852DE35|nr:hypothetical protein [Bosea sp. BIWAKO-01]GAU85490.1 hypothetical protein BIWAKO_05437 [Bosea sp. BIWAKO-01]